MHSDLTPLGTTGQPIVGPVTAPDHSTVHLSAPRRVLGVWAHPDDEAYLSAGLVDRVVRAGARRAVARSAVA